MKRVSFKVAKALKEAGYPQAETDDVYRNDGCLDSHSKWIGGVIDVCCDAPVYLEVWLWLWREKGIYIDIASSKLGTQMDIWDSEQHNIMGDNTFFYSSPEEAIIAAIEYLVINNLIK